MICAENSKNYLKKFNIFIEAAFSKSSLSKRIDFITRLLNVKSSLTHSIIKLEKLLFFVEWMNN